MDEISFSVLRHDRETNARLVHAFYRSSGVDRITKNGVSKKMVMLHCSCTLVSAKISEIFQDIISFCLQNKKLKKVIATGLHALAHILGIASMVDVYHA